MAATHAVTEQEPLTVGVLGGMGPQATVDFMHEVIARTPASGDQDHLRLLVDSNPRVPDRQAAIRGDDTAVRVALREMATGLELQGADFLVMPCNTAHAFVADAVAVVGIPFISIIDDPPEAATEAAGETRRAGLLATDACLISGVYQQAAAVADLELVTPADSAQAECMQLIRAVKGGDTGADVRKAMLALARSLVEDGVAAIIAGCTEIPLVLEDDVDGVRLISSTDVLAQKTVDYGLRRLPLPVKVQG